MHVLKLPLDTSEYDKQELGKRFRVMCRGHNILVRHGKKLIRMLNRDRYYSKLLKEYRSLDKDAVNGLAKAIARRKELSESMAAVRESLGLTKSGLQVYGKVFQRQHASFISSQMMQVEASRVWDGIEKVLFGNGKDIHYKKEEDMHTLGCKAVDNGIRYYDNRRDSTTKSYKPKHKAGVEYLGLDIAVRNFRSVMDDPYRNASLKNNLKYACISREMFSGGYRYYVILYLDGIAPKRIPDEERTPGVLGGDPGTSTIAVAGNNGLILEELSPACDKYNKRIVNLMRKIDRSRRLSNPDNYKPDGTCKKRSEIKGWTFSKTCRKDKRRLKTLLRKKAEYTRHEHNERANRIVCMCDTFINEDMSFSALARRSSKKAERSEKASVIKAKDGTEKAVRKFKKKKRFGKSVNDRSPAYQCTAIRQKLEQYGGIYLDTDTRSMKASQYCHDTGEYVKVQLSDRFKTIDGHRVQRDLYSAFITAHADDALSHPDRDACNRDFERFLVLHDELIARMKADGKSRKPCFGF